MNALEALELREHYHQEAETKLNWDYVKDEEGEITYDEDGEPVQRFRIENLEQANWALRKIAAYKKKQAEIDALKKAEIERIENWHHKESYEITKGIEFFTSLIEDYLRREREKDPKFKVSTPYGKATLRKQPAKWNYDEEKLLTFLKQAGKNEFIRIKEEVNKAELKKNVKVVNGLAVDENGEIIEGITIEEQPDKVVIDVEVE